jgi:hypothetical protein
MLLVLLVMIGLGTRGYIGTSPQGLKDSGFLSGRQPSCREYTAAEFSALGNDPKGKAATYSMDGEFVCERRIFEYGERNSFYDFVSEVAPGRVVKAARRLAQLQEDVPDLDTTFVVRIRAADQPVQVYLEHLVRTEFAGYMKKGAVANLPARPESSSVIEVEVSRIQDRDLLLKTAVVVEQGGKIRRWSL